MPKIEMCYEDVGFAADSTFADFKLSEDDTKRFNAGELTCPGIKLVSAVLTEDDNQAPFDVKMFLSVAISREFDNPGDAECAVYPTKYLELVREAFETNLQISGVCWERTWEQLW